jgi:hypothetical protein
MQRRNRQQKLGEDANSVPSIDDFRLAMATGLTIINADRRS